MRGSGLNSIYNARIPRTGFHSAPACAVRIALLILLLAATGAASQWQGPEIQLARKIVSVTGPGAVALTVTNRSFLGNAEAEEIRRGLTNELARTGVQVVASEQAAATVEVTLSQNEHSYVWVAEIHVGNNEPSVVMVNGTFPEGSGSGVTSSAITIHKALIWNDDHRILDVALPITTPPHMIVLEPESVVLYSLQNGRWQQEQAFAIAHEHPWPRDLRGRLVLRKDHLFDAFLPGVLCRSTATAPLGINCKESDDPWPLAVEPALNAFFAPTRNFFTGALSPGIQKQTATAPFYAAAALPRDKYTLWMFAGVDGQTHFLDGVSDQVLRVTAFGSEIASVHSGCGSGWQIVASQPNDSDHDTVKAFEIPDREPVPASPAVEFNGEVTALWPDSEAATVIVVSHERATGRYEAYRLSLTCGQ